MTGMAKHARKISALAATARKWQAALLTALIISIALGLAAYAAAASYDTVSAQAVAHGVSLPKLNPIGIDGGLFGIITLDIALTWAGHPIWWLRLAARLFAIGTVAANASAGWPSPVGVGLRIAAPALFILIVEAGRTILLRRRYAAEREKRAADRKRRRDNRIPRVRWLLDFRGTFDLWKRMRLWREPSYAKAVSMELERLAAIEKLAMKYGKEAWRDHAPADLVWMLTSGVRMTEALARVPELCRPEPEPVSLPKKPRNSAPKKPRTSGVNSTRNRAPNSPTEVQVPEDVDTQAEALRILAAEPDISGSELGRRLGKTERYGCMLKKQLAASTPGPDTPVS